MFKVSNSFTDKKAHLLFRNTNTGYYVPDNFKRKLLDLMQTFHKLCQDYNLTYWIEGGTLLGSVRNKRVIDWDDDIDVGMMSEDLKKIKNDINLEKYNLSLKWDGVYKIVYDSSSFPWIDIFEYKYCNNIYNYVDENHLKAWPNCFFYQDELHPLDDYKLNDIIVKGPYNGIEYLKRHYGENYMTPVYSSPHLHANDLNKI